MVEVTEPVAVGVTLTVCDPLDDRVKDADAEVVFDGAIERVRVGDAVCVFDPRPDFVVDGLDELVLEFVVVAVVVFDLRGVEDPIEDPVLVLELMVVRVSLGVAEVVLEEVEVLVEVRLNHAVFVVVVDGLTSCDAKLVLDNVTVLVDVLDIVDVADGTATSTRG